MFITGSHHWTWRQVWPLRSRFRPLGCFVDRSTDCCAELPNCQARSRAPVAQRLRYSQRVPKTKVETSKIQDIEKPCQVLPQLAEGLALAWEPLLAAVCSRRVGTVSRGGQLSAVMAADGSVWKACDHNPGHDPQARSICFENFAHLCTIVYYSQ